MTDQRTMAQVVLTLAGDVSKAAENMGLERSTVAAAARRFGWPNLGRMVELLRDDRDIKARAVEARVPAELIQALTAAEEAVLARIRVVEEAAAEAEKLRRAREEKAAAVEQMRVRLAKAEAELAELGAAAEPTTEQIRAWAAENGIACADRGRIPRSVRAAWDEAHR